MTSPESRGQGPIRVVVVDVEDAGASLPAVRDDGVRWAGAWLIVRVAGVPSAVVEVSLAGRDELPAEEVSRLAAAATADLEPYVAAGVPDAELPTATVVVPTNLARPDQLRAGLAALDGLDYPDADIVVVDNSRGRSSTTIAEVVAGLSRVRSVTESIPGIAAARNAGVRVARGEVVAFTDDDVRVDPGWLRALGERFARRPDEGAVTGLILPAELETPAQLWFERHYGGFGGTRVFAPLTYRGTGPGRGISRRAEVTVHDVAGREQRRFAVYGAGAAGAGANFAFRRSALERLGGFDLALGTGTPARGGEDLELLIRLLWQGGSIGYDPRAVVFHTHRTEADELRSQLHDYGLGFTAMLTALVLRDPRHVAGLLSQVPAVLRRRLSDSAPVVAAPAEAPVAPLGAPPPPDLARIEGRGGRKGPAAYLRSRRVLRDGQRAVLGR